MTPRRWWVAAAIGITAGTVLFDLLPMLIRRLRRTTSPDPPLKRKSRG